MVQTGKIVLHSCKIAVNLSSPVCIQEAGQRLLSLFLPYPRFSHLMHAISILIIEHHSRDKCFLHFLHFQFI
jgi:hypothetical protein